MTVNSWIKISKAPARVSNIMERAGISRTKSSAAHTTRVATMPRRCAWVAITGSAGRRKLGHASTPTSSTIRRDYVKTATLQNTIVSVKKKRERRSCTQSRKRKRRRRSNHSHRLKSLNPKIPRKIPFSKSLQILHSSHSSNRNNKILVVIRFMVLLSNQGRMSSLFQLSLPKQDLKLSPPSQLRLMATTSPQSTKLTFVNEPMISNSAVVGTLWTRQLKPL